MNIVPESQRFRRQRILQATRLQIATGGYATLTMRDLAASAGVATTTLYNIYGGKDEVVVAALEDVMSDLARRHEALQLRGLDAFIAYREMMGVQIVSTPQYAEAMTKVLFAAQPSDPIVQLLLDVGLKRTRRMLTEMADDGDLEEQVDIALLTRTVAGGNWSTLLLWMKGFLALHDLEAEFVKGGLMMVRAAVKSDSAAARQIDARLEQVRH